MGDVETVGPVVTSEVVLREGGCRAETVVVVFGSAIQTSEDTRTNLHTDRETEIRPCVDVGVGRTGT